MNLEPPNSKATLVAGVGNSFMNGAFQESGATYVLTRSSDMAFVKRTQLGGSIVNWRVNVPKPHWMLENMKDTALCCPAYMIAFLAPDQIKKQDLITQKMTIKVFVNVEVVVRA